MGLTWYCTLLHFGYTMWILTIVVHKKRRRCVESIVEIWSKSKHCIEVWDSKFVLVHAFSPFSEEYDFVIRCNQCSIMSWVSTFFQCHDTRGIAKRPHSCRNLLMHHEASVFNDQSHLPNHLFKSCIQQEYNYLLLCVFWILLLHSHVIQEVNVTNVFEV